MPTADSTRPPTMAALGPMAAMTRGARTTIPNMIRPVIGSSAAPLGKAE